MINMSLLLSRRGKNSRRICCCEDKAVKEINCSPVSTRSRASWDQRDHTVGEGLCALDQVDLHWGLCYDTLVTIDGWTRWPVFRPERGTPPGGVE